ncbi:pectate lyase family protein [Parapedobacter tibetensis]|uniref:pectate lyase family protein n=1 Tax=Parapedobacter tibetensis TaxID=2972951 RepID=UPI00214DD108|nr:pectate lyase [Parapedobacter tibetensis]
MFNSYNPKEQNARRMWRVVVLLSVCASFFQVEAQVLAFPGAEGFGKYTTGGRGGRVIKVTNLHDSGAGSLRKAIQAKGPRIVVFTVSGTIELESELRINNGDITIAGQSAPGDGICIRNYPVGVNADNVIVRFLRFRLGDTHAVEADALGGRNASNVMIDHCSISWATDECASFYRNRNFTMQWCLVAEPLNESVHTKGAHGYAGIWGGEGATFHHNLIANASSRTPRFSGSTTTVNSEEELVDFRNNVIYNWGHNNVYGGERGRYNVVGNYYRPGNATPKSRRQRLLNPSEPLGAFYLQGNIIVGSPEITADNRLGVEPDDARFGVINKEFTVEQINQDKAESAYVSVLKWVGSSLMRDAVDARIIREVEHGESLSGKKRNGIIDSQDDVGGWPLLAGGEYPEDGDDDGIPDAWERKHGLDWLNANDGQRNLDPLYDDIETYLNGLVAHIKNR